MNEILVSALVSTYNSEKFIRGCLEDLINQSLFKKNWMEIIVIDANSSQNEKAIVEEYKRKYPNIVYIRTPERIPLYAAWNVGIKQARGKYLTNANTDDRHHPAALELLANELEKFPEIALVYPDQIVTNKENETFEKFTVAGFTSYPEFDRQYLLNYTYIGHQPMWRSSLHKEFGLFNDKLKVASDYEWWLRISERYSFKHIPLLLGLYYYNTEGLERENTQLCLTETYQVRQFYQKKANKPSLEEFYPQNTYFKSYIDVTKSLPTVPDVSVILIANSVSGNLITTINSVLNQTFKNIEIIVLLSSQNETTYLKNYFYDKRVKIFESTSYPFLEKLKIGLNYAQGKYISIITDENKLFPRHLEYSLSILIPNPHISFVTNGFFKVKQGVGSKAFYEYERVKFLFRDATEELKKLSKEFSFVGAVFKKEALMNEKNLRVLCNEPELALKNITNFHIPQVTWEYLLPYDEKYSKPEKSVLEIDSNTKIQNLADTSKPPLVSVIIPCYNLSEFLPEAVESVVKQTFTDWECIIVDDGSTDNTRKVALSLQKRYPGRRIWYFEKQNEGVAIARNFGISKARGKYILPLDADDMIEPTFLEKAVKILETEQDISIVYCDVVHFGAESRIYPSCNWNALLEVNMNYLVSSSLYRKIVWDKVGGYKSNIGYEDWEFWVNAIEKGFKGKRIPEVLYLYRVRNVSRFKEDLTKDRINKAQIIKLHPTLYTSQQIQWAEQVLSGIKPPEYYNDQYCIMPITTDLKLDFKKCFDNQTETAEKNTSDNTHISESETQRLSTKTTESLQPKVYPAEQIEKLIESARSDEARQMILEFLNQNDNIIPALNDLAISFYLCGMEKEALNLLHTILLIDPNNPIAKENLELIQKKGT